MEHRLDPWMLLAVVALLGMSLPTLNTVSRVVGTNLLLRQILWGAAGLAILWLMSQVRLDVYERWAPALYAVGLVALVVVLFIGVARGGNRAWVAFGPVTVQPSEFARLGTVMFCAAWIANRADRNLRAHEVAITILIVAVPVILIVAEPDMGVALTYLPILVAALWLGGMPRAVWLLMIVLAAVAAYTTWQFGLQPYQKEWVMTVLNPDQDPFGAGYQVRQSKIAVGSGGLAGQGLGQGSQSQLRFLPAQHTDFAFAVWAEATGFVGTTALLLTYALLLGRIGLVALTAESRHGVALAVLVCAWLTLQIAVNLGMVLGWLPTTGITLPLFSYGGSSLISTCAAVGFVQAVWRNRLVNQ